MEVREEAQADERAVLDVHRDAFGREAEGEIVARLRRSGVACISVVAQVGASVVGHALCSEAQLVCESRALRIGALGPLGVVRAEQRHGIGGALIREALRLCWDRQWPAVIVLGNPAYYGRFGFRRADTWSIRCALDVPPEAFMIAFAGDVIRGPAVAHYHAAFG